MIQETIFFLIGFVMRDILNYTTQKNNDLAIEYDVNNFSVEREDESDIESEMIESWFFNS
jgi:hypothetical protein